MRLVVRLLLVGGLLAYAAGCGADEPAPPPPGSRPTPGGGDPADPASPQVRLLDWSSTGGSPDERRTVGSTWTALVDQQGRSVTFSGPDDITLEAGGGRVISQVAMDGDIVLVAEEPPSGEGEPAATVLDLGAGSSYQVTRPPAGRSWALHDGTLHYATFDPDGDYCLVATEVATGSGEFVHCAPARHGITRTTSGEHGTAFLLFDDQRPISCRTPTLLAADGRATPVAEAADCSAWDVAAMPGGAIWSEVPRERRADEGVFHAVADGTRYDLGPGTTGSLTPCGDSAYFVRDPAGRDDRAQLLRWTPDATLEVVFESEARGDAFLAPPECAGDVLTVSSFGAGGDEQVSATVPG